MNDQNLSALIWNTADEILRNVFKPSEYGRIILPFAVLRRLDCVLYLKKDKAKELFKKYKKKIKNIDQLLKKELELSYYNTSNYDLLSIKSDPNNVHLNFKNYINGYSDNVINILENFQLNPIIDKLNKNNKLYKIIDKFTEFDFHPDKIDNHLMGTIYEELLRKFSEISNEDSGDHYTPRDVVKLLVTLVMEDDKSQLKDKGIIKSIYDPCCGTGGMLTYGKDLIKKYNPDIEVQLFGQELNDLTYAICKSDFLMLNEDPNNIAGPKSTLSEDCFKDRKFDYIIANPPFGKNWKDEADSILEESKDPSGRFSHGIPWIKDGQLLFLSHMISKLNLNGGKIGLITNGSALTTGFGLRGESKFRKFLLEDDILESIICLPGELFFNTGILCYIWIINNKKKNSDKNKIKIFDFIDFYELLHKPIGDKKKKISDNLIKDIVKIYNSKSHERLKIYDKDTFLYKSITLNKVLLNEKLEPILGKNKKPKTEKIKYKISIDVNESSVLNDIPNKKDYSFDSESTIIGCEFHVTKFLYKNKKSPNYKLAKDKFFDTLKNIKNLNKTKITDFDFKKEKNIKYWFGNLKINWKLSKIGSQFQVRSVRVNESEFRPLSVTKNGIVHQLENVSKTIHTDNKRLVKIDDFVINSRSDRRGSSGVSPYEGSVSSVNIILQFSKKIFRPKFIHHLFRTVEFQEEFYRFGKGIVDDLWTTDYQDMKEILIPIPSLDEQDSILDNLEKVMNYEILLKDANNEFQTYKNSLTSNLIFSEKK